MKRGEILVYGWIGGANFAIGLASDAWFGIVVGASCTALAITGWFEGSRRERSRA